MPLKLFCFVLICHNLIASGDSRLKGSGAATTSADAAACLRLPGFSQDQIEHLAAQFLRASVVLSFVSKLRSLACRCGLKDDVPWVSTGSMTQVINSRFW